MAGLMVVKEHNLAHLVSTIHECVVSCEDTNLTGPNGFASYYNLIRKYTLMGVLLHMVILDFNTSGL